jgi:hypothetical protein
MIALKSRNKGAMIGEKLFDDAVRLSSLWPANSKASSAQAYRRCVEACVLDVYKDLISQRKRLVEDTGQSPPAPDAKTLQRHRGAPRLP